MNDPIAKAKEVLAKYSVEDAPAQSLDRIAKAERIKCTFDKFPDDPNFDGMLLYRGTKRAIIVNTLIDNVGRLHFTLSHEFGHHFMGHPPSYTRDGASGFRCTNEDIERTTKPREVEANKFAVEFLMPEEQFRFDMVGSPVDFGLIGSLAKQYMVSKHACSNRILSFTKEPCIIIRSRGDRIIGTTTSRAARGYLRNLQTLPESSAAYSAIQRKWGDDDFTRCDADQWFARTVPGNAIYECTHVQGDTGMSMTILKW